MPQSSVAVSDAALASVLFHSSIKVYKQSIFASCGIMIAAVAASLGTLKFSAYSPNPSLVKLHKYMSYGARVYGMLFVAIGFLRVHHFLKLSILYILLVLICLIIYALNNSFGYAALEAMSVSSVIVIACLSFFKWDSYALLGCLMFGLAALAGDEGTFLNILRVNIFHYLVLVAHIFLMLSFDQYHRLKHS